MVLFRDIRLKNRFYVQTKIYFEAREKIKRFFFFLLEAKQKRKTNHSYLEQRPKPFQPTKHHLGTNIKRKKISKLPY